MCYANISVLALANFIFLVAHVVRMRRARKINANNINSPQMAEEGKAPAPTQTPLGFDSG
jgi:hypothetical protein